MNETPLKGGMTAHITGIIDWWLMGMWAQVTPETPEIQMVFPVESLGFKCYQLITFLRHCIGQIKNNHLPHLLALTFWFSLGLLNLHLVLSNDPSTQKHKLLQLELDSLVHLYTPVQLRTQSIQYHSLCRMKESVRLARRG